MRSEGETNDSTGRFSLVAGGPFGTLLGRLGLLGADRLPTTGAAVGIALLAWAIPGVLAVAESLLDERYVGWQYFGDWTAYARFFVAVFVMLATERYADRRLTNLVRHFRESRLLADADLPAFNAAVDAADRRSASTAAELVILAVAGIWSGLATTRVVDLAHLSWEGTLVGGAVVLSWAGEASRFASNPLFVFLVLRWLWRFGVWTQLLFRLSRLPLQLTPLHPDRAGGLGFLSIYPGIFNGFVFALSCVIASSMVKELALERHSADVVWLALAVWLCLCIVLVLGPLLVFAWPLYQLRERALLDYGRLATQHHIAFHRKWIGEARSGERLMGSPDPSSASDINATVTAVLDMRFAPVDRLALVQLVVAAGLPLLAVVPTQVPVAEVARWLLGHVV
jgi:hypothetical protein